VLRGAMASKALQASAAFQAFRVQATETSLAWQASMASQVTEAEFAGDSAQRPEPIRIQPEFRSIQQSA